MCTCMQEDHTILAHVKDHVVHAAVPAARLSSDAAASTHLKYPGLKCCVGRLHREEGLDHGPISIGP